MERPARIRRHLSYANVAATLALVLGTSGGAYAAVKSGDDGGSRRILGCFGEDTGTLRVVASQARCGRRETPISWNAQGPRGRTGERGAMGARGPQGAVGVRGADGGVGIPGTPGVQGLTGGAGATGPQGIQGIAGMPGAGVRGAAGGRGAKGDRGGAGPAGARGGTGADGAAGPQGVAGPQGATGPQGAAGATGAQGAAGPAGPKGDPGQAGPSQVAWVRGPVATLPAGDHLLLVDATIVGDSQDAQVVCTPRRVSDETTGAVQVTSQPQASTAGRGQRQVAHGTAIVRSNGALVVDAACTATSSSEAGAGPPEVHVVLHAVRTGSTTELPAGTVAP
ncbi:hypothetical protein [Patulibacter sp. SYSU D01012]|uniref:hypothetical protein n=1 Tax=Patulibacter sp. SYSU D01012 TaxID=2817381 RepID=UPI001B301D58|nr:hypothetical protein [Patulibacter sp. SYSU D01012]